MSHLRRPGKKGRKDPHALSLAKLEIQRKAIDTVRTPLVRAWATLS